MIRRKHKDLRLVVLAVVVVDSVLGDVGFQGVAGIGKLGKGIVGGSAHDHL